LKARGPSILVIDDDPAIRRMLRQLLAGAGYRVQDATPGEAALERVAERRFNLPIVDIDEPPGIGPGLIRIMRSLSPAPILALSVRSDESAAVSALQNGADDYVRKPFGGDELLARVMTALRRTAREQGKPPALVTGDLEINLLLRRIRLRGREVRLSVKLYEVLRVLAEKPGRVLTHEEILRRVWGRQSAKRVDYVRVAVRKLRRQLEIDPSHPRYLVTEPGIGYRLEVRHGTAVERSGGRHVGR
jgi:two-component system, OmpR family, KDP operon response regulator KdpE